MRGTHASTNLVDIEEFLNIVYLDIEPMSLPLLQRFFILLFVPADGIEDRFCNLLLAFDSSGPAVVLIR